ncbi:OB-fold putative lipoprotein [Aliarcobacter butzleri]|uniref:OB-fold putative lipoprotein n=1 Tax=Aliarcobacter butzleri TaxID=28197 RepID=UPI0021B56709|nr:OB-fold putative lipoprotein [Aliarcobacter butzleri]MCT7637041.1 OB-fold putative lipoprotein [Aliarcobacter butzleri]
MYKCMTCGNKFEKPKRPMTAIWIIFIFFSMGLGLIVWLLSKKRCPYCNSETFIDTKFIQGTTSNDNISYQPVKKQKEMTTLAKVVYGTLAFFVFIAFFSSLNKKDDEKEIQGQQQVKNLFNELETNMFKSWVNISLKDIEEDRKSVLIDNAILIMPLKITADKLQREYVKNEAKADEQYKNKILLVSGKIDNIQKDAFNNMNLKLIGGDNMFLYPTAQVEDKYTSWVASLNKGNNVKLVCKGRGFVIGSASLGNCSPLDSWLKEQNIGAKVLEFYKNTTNRENEIVSVIEVIKYISPRININKSSCNTSTYNSDKCLQEMSELVQTIQKEKNSK